MSLYVGVGFHALDRSCLSACTGGSDGGCCFFDFSFMCIRYFCITCWFSLCFPQEKEQQSFTHGSPPPIPLPTMLNGKHVGTCVVCVACCSVQVGIYRVSKGLALLSPLPLSLPRK